jgi:hypothetical protein
VKGGWTVKKLSLLLAVTLVFGSLGFSAFSFAITQQNSFTYTSTAGMFEDMYDYYRLSPAYLPSFNKNSFWGQLSNLENSQDQQINNGNPGGNDSYLLGGQVDLMGMGRIGAMFDWYGQTISDYSENYNTSSTFQTGNGFFENTNVGYTISSGSSVIDTKTESYSHVKRVDNYADNDVYVPYGLGGIMGLDLGVAVHGSWWDDNPTYDNRPGTAITYGNVGYTFDENTYVRQTNLLSGALVNEFDRTSSGSLDYGQSEWGLVLGGRLKGLMPNLDLVVNVAPELVSRGNKLKAEMVDKYDYQPGNPSVLSNETTTHSLEGIEPGVGVYPGSGIGVAAGVRGEYLYTPNINLIGTVSCLLLPMTLSSDAKEDTTYLDVNNQTLGGLTQVTNTNNVTHDKYEGKTNNGNVSAQLRSQFLAKGWKLGLGINYMNSWDTSEITQTDTVNNVTQLSGTGNPAQDNTATETYGYVSKVKSDILHTQIDLPVGVVINLLDTLPIRFGAVHSIVYTVSNSSTEITSRTPDSVTRNYADGHATTTINAPPPNVDEYSNSSADISHNNYFYYGASWWPYKDVQIDFTGFAGDVLALTNYNLSFNFYF